MNKMLFTGLVTMLSTSVMQQLGKLTDPVTNKAEVNLEAAQITIDMLEMLNQKTKGNLDTEEERLLTSTLSMLQMNYVETSKTASQAPGGPAPEPPPPEETPEAPPEPDDPRDAKDPKFHKSYGE